MKLSDQFENKLRKSITPFLQDGPVALASELNKAMHRNVDRGDSFEPAKYEKGYATKTMKDRRRSGLQAGFADLQRKLKRVKDSKVKSLTDRSAEIFYEDSKTGVIMHAHNFGLSAKGNLPRRLLFPDVTADGKLHDASAVPESIVDEIEKTGSEIMNKPV